MEKIQYDNFFISYYQARNVSPLPERTPGIEKKDVCHFPVGLTAFFKKKENIA